MKALCKQCTWEAVKRPPGVKVVDCKWVYKIKRSADESEAKFKSRLVARGFAQEYGVNYLETYAPVVKNSSVRVLMAMAVKCGFKVQQIDIKNAYINSELEEDVYMKQPEGFEQMKGDDVVLKLKKSLYGLKQSGNAWNKCLNSFLNEIEFKRMKTDPCVYKKGEKLEDIIILAVYVDDIIIFSRDSSSINELKSIINSKFKIDDIGQCEKVIGMRVKCSAGVIKISQPDKISELCSELNMTDCRKVDSPMEAGLRLCACDAEARREECGRVEASWYRSIVGKLNFIASTTRPDLMFPLSYLSQFSKCPHPEHATALRRVIRYLSCTKQLGIRYDESGATFEAFSDSDWAGSVDRRSYTGFVIKMSGGCVAWEAKKQRTVALSSTEAEYMALTSAAKELMYLNNFIRELEVPSYEPGEMMLQCDNKGAMAIAKKIGYSARTKHIEVRHHFIRELVEAGVIKVEYVNTKDNLADIFTKPVGPIVYRKLADEIVYIV